ncbi:conjugal transfer protein TraB [Allochromatium humboldtianum]|uniref:Conjugal transfer protein TraB n=1 Tax=Allochromatium humboldtianum TaxID=504901 RepID=A0A850RB62_9GAMM|nr:TrbI/VirB10 family protein [Allochromatium humboldtianum]NVZ08200.1 conjugal transfer protein TraB [Allochromatium humboldtianum]
MPVRPLHAWERLSPTWRRWLVIGGVLGTVALIAVLAFEPQTPTATRTQEARERLTRRLLTDTDPRTLGIDGLAQRLEQLERQLAQAATRQSQRDSRETTAVNQQVEQLRQAQDVQVEALRQEIARLKTALEAPQTMPQPPSPPATPEAGAAPTPPPAAPAAEPAAGLFERRPATAVTPLSPNPATRTPNAGALSIRVVEQTPTTQATATAATPPGPIPDPGAEAIVIPAGSLLRGVLLSGMDAPTGRQARRDPYPALVRLKHEAILPNRFRADVRECFITVAGYGELSSERAFLRTEVITCVRHDGGVIEVPMDGYAVGEDGKVGLRGRLVSKQGQVIARAMQVSFLQGISDVFNKSTVTTISTTSDGTVRYQDVLSSDSAQAAAITGTGKALDRLAQYYLDMAENIFPVIEIDAGRAIEVILNRGASLQLAGPRAARGVRR